jgi:hypothetical protein
MPFLLIKGCLKSPVLKINGVKRTQLAKSG